MNVRMRARPERIHRHLNPLTFGESLSFLLRNSKKSTRLRDLYILRALNPAGVGMGKVKQKELALT